MNLAGEQASDQSLPCRSQTHESIYEWAKELQVGDTVAVRQSSSHIYFEYRLRKVEAITEEGRRVLVSDGEGTFWRTPNAAGKNCMHPKGQTCMVQPTSAVRKAAKAGKRLAGGE